MKTINLGALADAAIDEAPSRLAFIFPGDPCSYGELDDVIARVTACLLDAGVQPGDRIPIIDVASATSVAGIIAAARLGAAAALINPVLRPGEMEALLTTGGCRRLALVGDAFADVGRAAVGHDLITASNVRRAEPVVCDVLHDAGEKDIALVLFTSGTTGAPKAVPIPHGVLTTRITGFASPFSADVRSVKNIMCVPFHNVGGSLGVLGSLYAGNTFVVQERFEAGEWLHLVHRHQVAGAFLVPTMLQRILDHPSFAVSNLDSLISISYGAAAAPRDLIERAMHTLPHVALANLFGQTETLGAYAAFSPEDYRQTGRLGSIGRPLPGVRLRIVRPRSEVAVHVGEVGEILVLSPHNVEPGWLRTGDLARADTDGYLFSAGRLADTINRHGVKFGPVEIDAVLRRHPAVSDVAVTGMPDSESGERVEAAVVLAAPSTEAELRDFCLENLARFKVPERITFVADIPYNETGKVNRSALVALLSGVVD
jgi:acyl-CoA synthetase (AMP-forming)/AMP-acid ligase II